MIKAFRRNCFVIVCCLLATFFFNFYSPAMPVSGTEMERAVYIGGFPVGLVIKPKGVIVVGVSSVETEMGSVQTQTPIRSGDIIERVNGNDIDTAEDIHAALEATDEMTVNLGVRRGTALLSMNANLIKEDLTGEKRLGLQVRESVAGVGTVTYVKPDGSFGSLGHPISLLSGGMVPCDRGASYQCKIVGYARGSRGKTGELKGAFTSTVPNGTVYKNCGCGVFGKFNGSVGDTLVEVADRKSVSIGKASILTTIEDKPEKYSIEIIRTAAQNSASDKSMVIRVTDKRLLNSTGGIVQGMSGSPILQNGKLVGAVTHVFVSDPTKGYGIYADWMLQNQ